MKKVSCSRFVISLNETFDEYCDVSSFHGMKFFKDKTTSKYLRILWALTILASISMANQMAISLYIGFIEDPVRLIIETDHAISAKILFPSVTVCPGTLYNHSKAVNVVKSLILPEGVNVEDVLENLDQIYAFTEPKFKYSREGLNLLTTVMKFNNYTLIEFLKQTYWDCGKFFFRCRFQSRNVNCSEVFLINRSHAGFCCSFNSLQSRDRIKEFKASRHGLRQGLSIILNNVEFDAKHTNSNARRFQMLIHRPNSYPDESTFRKFLFRNEEVLLGFDPIETTYSSEVWKRLSIDERNCTLLSETQLHLFKEYNRQNCVSECMSSIFLKLCGCVPFNLFMQPTTLVCDFEHISCLSNKYGQIAYLRDHQCKCVDSCEKVEFTVRLTSGNIEKTVEVTDPFYDGFRPNLTVVHIFLKSQEYRRIRRDIVWNIVSLAGNLGNCYSVFVGISALSILELLYYLTFVLGRNYKSTLNSEKKILLKSLKMTAYNAKKPKST